MRYQYSPTLEGKYPQQHLKSFEGVLQADAYRGYGALYARVPGEAAPVQESSCWAIVPSRVLSGVAAPTQLKSCFLASELLQIITGVDSEG